MLSLQKYIIDMSKSYENLSLFEFQQKFASDNQYLAYLAAEKMEKRLCLSKMRTYALLCGMFALFPSMYEVQTYRFANSRHPFSQGKIFAFEGILYRLLGFDKQKRHRFNGIESQIRTWSKNVLVFQTQGNESDEKQW